MLYKKDFILYKEILMQLDISIPRLTKRLALTAGLSCAIVLLCALQPAHAKRPYTITERQVALSKDIAADQKTGDLTLKEADDLRAELGKIAAKESKMKASNGGKLSVEDNHTLEGCLNKVSLKIKKKELAKRTER